MSEVLEPPVTHPVTAALESPAAAPRCGGRAGGSGRRQRALDHVRSRAARGCGGRVPPADASGRRVLHGLVREIDARGAATDAGAHSTAGWLRSRLHLHPGAARRMVTTARGLHDDSLGRPRPPRGRAAAPTGRHLLRSAFAAGDISGEHAAVACETLAALPASLDDSVVDQAEAFLAEHATPARPEGAGPAGPAPAPRAGHRGDPGGRGEEHQRARQVLEVRQRSDGSSDVRGHLGVELTAEFLSQLQPLAGPRPARRRQPRPADGGAAQRRRPRRAAAAQRDRGGTTPARHGSRASITVTMALETLERRLGAPGATLDWSGPISAATARRLACDAHLVPVVLGAQGEPLDVGRASYPVTQAIWRALVARDGGCGFDGCGRPPEWTEAHHLVHWADGGETSVENCCLFCDHHHRKSFTTTAGTPQLDRRCHPRDPATLGRPRTAYRAPTPTPSAPRSWRPPETTRPRPTGDGPAARY